MSDVRKAYVYIKKKYAGILQEIDSGYSFEYNDEYYQNKDNPSVSLTMPITQKEDMIKLINDRIDSIR